MSEENIDFKEETVQLVLKVQLLASWHNQKIDRHILAVAQACLEQVFDEVYTGINKETILEDLKQRAIKIAKDF